MRAVFNFVFLLSVCPLQLPAQKQLSPAYENNDFQLTGVTVSQGGRMFVNFPRWSDKYLNAVVEVQKGGSIRPFPDEFWNRWDKKPENAPKQFVCVQSVVADDQNTLWIVDPASPLIAGVVPGGAKVVRVDLGTNKVTRIYSFGSDVVRQNSYLNDIRVDNRQGFAYMTDSGHGGIIVLNIQTGKAHRALDGHPSIKPEQGVSISVNGKPVIGPDGKPPQFASDGIALSHAGDYLYWQALTGATLYRLRTKLLQNAVNDPNAAVSGVEKVTRTFPVDGLWMDAQDRIYLSNINESAVYRWAGGKMEKLLSDPKLVWPDTFSQGPDGTMYITASHISDGPQYNQGKSTRTLPYAVFQFRP